MEKCQQGLNDHVRLAGWLAYLHCINQQKTHQCVCTRCMFACNIRISVITRIFITHICYDVTPFLRMIIDWRWTRTHCSRKISPVGWAMVSDFLPYMCQTRGRFQSYQNENLTHPLVEFACIIEANCIIVVIVVIVVVVVVVVVVCTVWKNELACVLSKHAQPQVLLPVLNLHGMQQRNTRR